MKPIITTRREFVKRTVIGGVGLAAGLRATTWGGTARADINTNTATVAVTQGGDRADNAFRALQYFKQQIATAIGNKRVIIKPNFVVATTALACTNVAWVEGILEFLKSIGKTHVTIAECPYNNAAMVGFDKNGYLPLANRYSVQFADLTQEGVALAQIWQNPGDPAPTKTIRVAKLYLNPNNFIISACPMKTHDTGFATLSCKNIVMSAPITDPGFPWSQMGCNRDKTWMHGSSNTAPGNAQALNNNVYWLAHNYGIHPHLAVLDGYQGMDGNGPASGQAVNQQVGIVSLDWVAADRVALAMMTKSQLAPGPSNTGGIWKLLNAQPYPAYLNYCWQATPSLGQWDMNYINVVSLGFPSGKTYADFALDYRPNNDITTVPQFPVSASPPPN